MKQKTFERALHRWDKWLDSIDEGRKVLRFRESPPSLRKMRSVAGKALGELGFPSCTIFELYWLCCVLCDYATDGGFKFDKLVLPDWFPLPFGFKDEEFIDKKLLDLKGGCIKPPLVWDEADRMFWFAREPIAHYLPLEIRGQDFQHYPKKDFIIVLPSDHPIHKYVKRGRPPTTQANGETMLD